MADPINIYIGRRLKSRRVELGVSQASLGAPLGLSFQQIQKYEHGTNRISAANLYRFCQSLNVPLEYFYEGLPEEEESVFMESEPKYYRDIIQPFKDISDEGLVKQVMSLIKAIGKFEKRLTQGQ